MKTRKAIFRAKGMNFDSKADLSQLFLSKSEVLITAQKTCHESIEVFEWWLDEEIKKLKELRIQAKKGIKSAIERLEKDQKFFKIDKTASSAVLWKIMRYYFKIEINQKEKEKRNNLTKKIAGMMNHVNNSVVEVDEFGNVVADDRISRASSIKGEEDKKKEKVNLLEGQRKAIVKEIQKEYREANLKYQACILMAGFVKSIENISNKMKESSNEVRSRLKVYIDQIEDEEVQRRMFIKMGGYYGKEYFDNGSKVKENAFDNMMRTLRKNPDTVKFNVDVEHRSRAYGTRCSQFQDLMNFLVHQNKKRFKIKKLSKKEQEAKNIEFVNKNVKENYKVNNIEIQKDRNNQDLLDRSIMMEDDIHDIVDNDSIYYLEEKLLEKVKSDRNYLEDQEFTSENKIKTKVRIIRNFSRQQSVVSDNMTDDAQEKPEEENDELLTSVIVEKPEEHNSDIEEVIEVEEGKDAEDDKVENEEIKEGGEEEVKEGEDLKE